MILKLFFIFLIYLKQSTQSKIDVDTLIELKNLLSKNGFSIDEMLNDFKSSFHFDQEKLIESSFFKNDLRDFTHQEPDMNMSPKQMIEFRGFKYEEHDVITEDCYILTMHRLVHPTDNTPNKPPVLLIHGILDSSTEWLVNSVGGHIDDKDNRNLAFALAKKGYDVWLGNFRGNTYAMKHVWLSAWNPKFWKYSLDNHALQDLPAMIGYIQKKTDFDQIEYVGYSQGTSSMFQLLSMKPEVSQILSSYVALSPVSFSGNITTPLKYLAKIPFFVKTLLYINLPFLQNNFLFKKLLPLGCRMFGGELCKQSTYFLAGYSENQLNKTRLPVYFEHLPAGVSIPNLMKFGQTFINGGKCEMLNYMSEKKNRKCYNSPSPPRIPLEKINLTNMYLIYGESDKIVDKRDVQKLVDSLSVKVFIKAVEEKNFGHLDFIWSQNLDKLVNNDVIDVLDLHKPLKSKNGLRFKQFTKTTCHKPNTKSFCHISDLNSVLDNIF